MNHTLALALTLTLILSGCASTPKSDTSAEITPAPQLIDLITDRALAQAAALETVGVKGLVKLLNAAKNTPNRSEVSYLVQNAALKMGIKLDPKKSLANQGLNDIQANQILTSILDQPAVQNNSAYSEIAPALKKASAQVDLSTSMSVDAKGQLQFQETTRHLVKGFGAEKAVVQNYVTVRHYTGVELMTKDTCTVFPGKLTPEAAGNVKKYWGVQAQTAEEIAAIKGLSQAQRYEKMVQRGYCKTVDFFKTSLNVPADEVAATIETASTQCKIVPQAYLVAQQANFSCN
jgi:hypothetical protein